MIYKIFLFGQAFPDYNYLAYYCSSWRTFWRTAKHFYDLNISKKISRNKQKTWYYFEWGKQADQRKAANVFTYNHPKNSVEKAHHAEALNLLAVKKPQFILDTQAAVRY